MAPRGGRLLDRVRHRLRSDRGASAVEAVILYPVVLLLIFATVQAGLFYYGRATALAAAQQGLQAARVETGSTTTGLGAAQEFLGEAGSGGGLLDNVTITPTRTAATTTVTVSATIPSLVPGATFAVSQTATGTVERVTTRTGGAAGGGGT